MHAAAVSTLLGGVGLFLLGMSLMTDSLTAMGGASLRRLLKSLARNRWAALLTGAVVTATVQSSSATTLVTVGFVSAGLLTFAESLGLIFGANIGTTATAWIVSLLGLKLQVSTVALPLVGVGALVRLVTRGRWSRIGLALSGFGLVFVGIDAMQAGMGQLELDLTPRGESGGLLGVLALVAAGMLMTVVLQSSSAAVATTLVALHAGSITIEQAGALVVGQNVGTTVTAIIGAIGGTVAAKRTAVAHTMFNVLTGVVAIAMLGPFIRGVQVFGARFFDESPQTAIAIFHTWFNLVGVAIVFPFTHRFARLVEAIVPSHQPAVVRRLDRTALQVPAVALEAARRATAEMTTEAVELAVVSLRSAAEPEDRGAGWRRVLHILSDPRALLEGGGDDPAHALAGRMRQASAAAVEISTYLSRIRTSAQPTGIRDEHVELLHAVDHLRRLVVTTEREDELAVIEGDADLRRLAAGVVQDLQPALARIPGADAAQSIAAAAEQLRLAAARESERREAHRVILLARLADGELEPAEAEIRLRAARWIGKVPKHAYRAFLHLAWTSGAPPIPELED